MARALLLALLLAACGPPPPAPLPPNGLAFGVVGDGPYHPWEQGRWRRTLADVRRADVRWLVHVGDFLWYPCTDAAYAARRAELARLGRPVVYTPGDNEWTDCHEERPGRHEPLERLASLRRLFFPDPARSLGAPALAVASQAADTAFAEFVENARWTRGGFVFATVHLVGSGNGLAPFPGRTAADDSAAARRLRAAVAWLDAAFIEARAGRARGVVLFLHADPGLPPDPPSVAHAPFVARLGQQVVEFPGVVLLVHGDSHRQRADHPLVGTDGRPIARFTRLETFGSPDIGWVRVVVDTVAGRVTAIEPRRLRGWW